MIQYVLTFVLSIALCLAAEFAGWHIRNTPGDFWKHAVRGPLMFAVAWAIVRIIEAAKGV